jgi:hypothetical protein
VGQLVHDGADHPLPYLTCRVLPLAFMFPKPNSPLPSIPHALRHEDEGKPENVPDHGRDYQRMGPGVTSYFPRAV